MHAVEIAGKTYQIRYQLEDRPKIESLCKKKLWDAMWSGELIDHANVVLVGLFWKHKDLTSGEVIRMFKRHQKDTGDYVDIVQDCFIALCEENLLGRRLSQVALARLKEWRRESREEDGTGEDGDGEGKGVGGTVKAAE